MSRIVDTFKQAFKKMNHKKWDTIYVFVDMHETVVLPTYETKKSEEFYNKSIETLQLMSKHKNVKLILWSSSLPEINLSYKEQFRLLGIEIAAINSNPFEENTSYADFKTKPYMSVILDDKAGFRPGDWVFLYDYFLLLNLVKKFRDKDFENIPYFYINEYGY